MTRLALLALLGVACARGPDVGGPAILSVEPTAGDAGTGVDAPSSEPLEPQVPECSGIRNPELLSCDGVRTGHQYSMRVTCDEVDRQVVVREEQFRQREMGHTSPAEGAPADMYTSVVDRIVTRVYDECGQWILEQTDAQEGSTSTDGALRFDYDRRGNRVRETSTSLDGAHVFRVEQFVFDNQDRLVGYRLDGDNDGAPDHVETYEHNENGDLVRSAIDHDGDGMVDTRCWISPPCSARPPNFSGCPRECREVTDEE